MKTNKTFWTGVAGLLIGFVAGAVAYPVYQSTAHAREKKKKKSVVRELERIGDAISDRNSPVVHQLEEITDELDEISDIQRNLGVLVPCEIRVFDDADIEQAREWIRTVE